MELDHTHDPAARSWLASANQAGTDFPIQNLPFGLFRRAGRQETLRGGVAIGDQILDLAAACGARVFDGLASDAAQAAAGDSLNAFLAMGPVAWRALRHAIFDPFREGASSETITALEACLVPQTMAELELPNRIANYTDFYTSIHHARNVGRVFKPDDPVSPNFQWLPIAYHGRASSVVVSGTSFHRPMGQAMPPGSNRPVYGPCTRLGLRVGDGHRHRYRQSRWANRSR